MSGQIPDSLSRRTSAIENLGIPRPRSFGAFQPSSADCLQGRPLSRDGSTRSKEAAPSIRDWLPIESQRHAIGNLVRHDDGSEASVSRLEDDAALENAQHRYYMESSHRVIDDAKYIRLRDCSEELFRIDNPALRDGRQHVDLFLDALNLLGTDFFEHDVRPRGTIVAAWGALVDGFGMLSTLVQMIKVPGQDPVRRDLIAPGIGLAITSLLIPTLPWISVQVVNRGITQSEMGLKHGIIVRSNTLRQVGTLGETQRDLGGAIERLKQEFKTFDGTSTQAGATRAKAALIEHAKAYAASHLRAGINSTYTVSRAHGSRVAIAKQFLLFVAPFLAAHLQRANCTGSRDASIYVLLLTSLARVLQIGLAGPRDLEEETMKTLEVTLKHTRILKKDDVREARRSPFVQRYWLTGELLRNRMGPMIAEIGKMLNISRPSLVRFDRAGGFHRAPFGAPLDDESIAALDRLRAMSDGRPIAGCGVGVGQELIRLHQLAQREKDDVKLKLFKRMLQQPEPERDGRGADAPGFLLKELREDSRMNALLKRCSSLVDGMRNPDRAIAAIAGEIGDNKALDDYANAFLEYKDLNSTPELRVLLNSPDMRDSRERLQFLALLDDPGMTSNLTEVESRQLAELKDKYIHRISLTTGDFNDVSREVMLSSIDLAGREACPLTADEEGVLQWLETRSATSTLSFEGWNNPRSEDSEEDSRRRQRSLTPIEHVALMSMRARPRVDMEKSAETGRVVTDHDTEFAMQNGSCQRTLQGMMQLPESRKAIIREKLSELRNLQLDAVLQSWNFKQLSDTTRNDVLNYLRAEQSGGKSNSQVTNDAVAARWRDPAYTVPAWVSQMCRSFFWIVGGSGASVSLPVLMNFARRVSPDRLGQCIVGTGPDEQSIKTFNVLVGAGALFTCVGAFNAVGGPGANRGAANREWFYSFPEHLQPSAWQMIKKSLPAGLFTYPFKFHWRTSVSVPAMLQESAELRSKFFRRLDALGAANLPRVVPPCSSATIPRHDMASGVSGHA